MLRFRSLPVIVQLSSIPDPKEALRRRNAIMEVFFRGEAAQLIAAILQEVYAQALDEIEQGKAVEMNVGRMRAVRDMRQMLVSLLPEDQQNEGDDLLNSEAEEPYLDYSDSGFNIPLP